MKNKSNNFKSSLSEEEIEKNFKDFNLFNELKESLSDAIELERKNNETKNS